MLTSPCSNVLVQTSSADRSSASLACQATEIGLGVNDRLAVPRRTSSRLGQSFNATTTPVRIPTAHLAAFRRAAVRTQVPFTMCMPAPHASRTA